MARRRLIGAITGAQKESAPPGGSGAPHQKLRR